MVMGEGWGRHNGKHKEEGKIEMRRFLLRVNGY